jgi:hypothetical protein
VALFLSDNGSGTDAPFLESRPLEVPETHTIERRPRPVSRTGADGKVLAEYDAWHMCIQRCENPNNPGYKTYGARGIRVCHRWHSFENFFADMGPRPSPRHSIDRIDNDGDYEPGNCRWATPAEQARNRRTNRMIEFGGRTMCISDWAAEIGISCGSLMRRLDLWGVERALTTPARKEFQRFGPSNGLSMWARRRKRTT